MMFWKVASKRDTPSNPICRWRPLRLKLNCFLRIGFVFGIALLSSSAIATLESVKQKMDQADYPEALTEIKKLLKQKHPARPVSSELLWLKANCEISLGRSLLAQKTLRELLDQFPQFSPPKSLSPKVKSALAAARKHRLKAQPKTTEAQKQELDLSSPKPTLDIQPSPATPPQAAFDLQTEIVVPKSPPSPSSPFVTAGLWTIGALALLGIAALTPFLASSSDEGGLRIHVHSAL